MNQTLTQHHNSRLKVCDSTSTSNDLSIHGSVKDSSSNHASHNPLSSMPNNISATIQNKDTSISSSSFSSRQLFTRSALFTALASSLVGFGMAPAVADEVIPTNKRVQITTNTVTDNSVTDDDTSKNATANTSSYSQNSTANEQTSNEPPSNEWLALEDDEQLDLALDALRLKRAVEQGIIDRSVLEDYNEQSLGLYGKDDENSSENEVKSNDEQGTNSNSAKESDQSVYNPDDALDIEQMPSNDNLLQEAMSVQQQGYQMMTPEQIDAELAAMDKQNAQDIDAINNNDSSSTDSTVGDDFFDNELHESRATFDSNIDEDFDAPIATLNDNRPPIGLDVGLDSATLPTPTNSETLGRDDELTAAEQAETVEIMSRPINVSNSVSSGRVDAVDDVTQQANPEQALAQQDENNVTGADDTISETQAQINAGRMPEDETNAQNGDINPDDYLPDYESETQAVAQSLEQASKPKTSARNKPSIVKRLYNRLFNGGVMALPNIETTIYLQQEPTDNRPNTTPVLVEADNDIQPMNNMKAALDDINVQSVVDFTAALPRLRQAALDAARAVGYYDVTLRLRQPTSDTIDVIIEKLGEPVRVDTRIVDIRGEGSEQKEFKAIEENVLPKEDEIFNHRVYKTSKAALESLSNTYGYFDKYWLNKSVDIILPDNTADISLVYDTGERYEFDDVVFFTYDEATNTLTRDPEKLPVELSLLHQLHDFESGDPFYRPAVTKFSNDLSATRYFNTVNVESILPPDERNENSTLAFDNAPADTEEDSLDDDVLTTDGTSSSENRVIDDRFSNNQSEASVKADKDNANDDNTNKNNVDGDNTEADSMSAQNSGATVAEEDVAPIEFTVDQETEEKLNAIKQKAERLINLPDDRVLDEKAEKAENLLGRISDSISNVAEKIFPEEESVFEDENFVPPTLAGRITPEEVVESKKVPLYVFVSADKPRDAQVGLGYGTDTGVRATAKLDYNLVNRKGYQAGVETEVSRINKNVTVYGSRPWKHPLNDKLDARLTYQEEVIDQGEGNFDLSTKTLKAALARNIRRESGWNRSYSVRYRLDELETSVEGAELENLPVRFTSSKPQQQALLFGYGINKTDVDSVTNPTRGFRQYYNLEVGSKDLISDTDLAIARAGVHGIYSFGEDQKHQVLGGLDTGYIWADDFYDVPYKLRFFAGGDQSIRGYDYESLSPLEKGYLTGGQILAVGSAEYNYEFRPGFRGAVFTDVGNAYDKDFETDTKVGVGVGIRWASPVGVVRLDVAAGVTEDSIPVRLHFFIGSPL